MPSPTEQIDGNHLGDIPLIRPLREHIEEAIRPFSMDKYGKCIIPESPQCPNGQAAEKQRLIPGRPARSKLLRVISQILHSKPPKIHSPPFVFEPTVEAARQNFQVLQQHDMNLDAALSSGPLSPNSFGSEFRDTAILEPLYGIHPDWPKMKSILDFGTSFPMEELSEPTRQQDLKAALIRGNHQSAKGEKANILVEKTVKEISNGWCLPLLVEHAASIPGAMYSPMGIAEQANYQCKG